MVPTFFASNFLFYFIVLYGIISKSMIYYRQEDIAMKVTTSKSKNSESFYIAKSYINNKGKSTSVNVRKLGTLKELLLEHGPTRDDVMKWAKEEAQIETLKYKKEQLFRSRFVPIRNWITISSFYTVVDIFSRSLSTIVSSLIKCVENFGININSNMISMRSFPISFMPESLSQPANVLLIKLFLNF